MIVKQYIKEFEKLGFGMFVHFGIYSVFGKGEWAKCIHNVPDEEYYALMEQFDPKPDWAKELVATAKKAGCKYITLTTRHHDGFSLFDTCGLNKLDAVHAKCGRDLVREFVDECNSQGIIPFLYHTLLDWYQETYQTDFPTYLKYLRDSVEILCTKYGKIGGLWFDGMWDKRDEDWQEDELYACIRKHQPEAMIINNSGRRARGKFGHIELDSVTFERDNPQRLNMEGRPKYVASEMCETLSEHWGYAAEDLNFKSPALLIKEMAECRKYGANMLLNVGPKGDGSLRAMDTAMLEVVGQWVDYFDEAIRQPRPTDIIIENKPKDFLLKDGKNYYLFCFDLPMRGDPNVTWYEDINYTDAFDFEEEISSITWMDNGMNATYIKEGNKILVCTEPYAYGCYLVVRVAKIVCK